MDSVTFTHLQHLLSFQERQAMTGLLLLSSTPAEIAMALQFSKQGVTNLTWEINPSCCESNLLLACPTTQEQYQADEDCFVTAVFAWKLSTRNPG